MPIQSYKINEGTLILGTTPLDVTAQVTSFKVSASEEVTSTDAIPVLSGEEIAAEEEASNKFALEGNLLQDLSVAGVVAWSWANAGTWQPFVFVPNNALDRAVGGLCCPVPLEIGGDVKARGTSDLTWRIQGTPVFGAYDEINDEVDPDV